jgi:uncharacterized membrane protein
VTAQQDAKKKEPTLSQRVTDQAAKVIRSWGFLVCQLVFVAAWFGAHHFFPRQLPFDILQIILLTEGCCIGSIFLHSQYRQAALDRRITLSDYIIECQIQKELKQLHPMITALHNDMEKKKNFGCDEPRYKCCGNEEKPGNNQV